MVGKLNLHEKYNFSSFFIAMANRQPRIMASHMLKLAVKAEVDDVRRLEHEMEMLADEFIAYNFENRNLNDLTIRLRKIVYDFKMSIPGTIFILLRALAILEGIGRIVDPEMRITDEVKSYGFKLFKEQYSPKNLNYEIQWLNPQ